MNSTCVFTLHCEDGPYLENWARYWSGKVDCCLVVVHSATDGAPQTVQEHYPAVRIFRIKYPFIYDEEWISRTAQYIQWTLRREFDCVVFTSADEILLTDPAKLPDLATFLRELEGPFAWCEMGYHVMDFSHARADLRDEELPLDWTDPPILAQRKWWVPDITYGTPCISLSEEIIWHEGGGFHGAKTPERRIPGLYLAHLHHADYATCERKYRRLQARGGFYRTIPENHKIRLQGENFRRHFYDLPEYYDLKREEIPQWAKEAA